MNPIYTYSELNERKNQLSDFARGCFERLVSNISKTDFPCYFAKNVISKNSLYMAFVENPTGQNAAFEQALQAFAAYAEIEKQPDPYRVLVLSFELPAQTWEQDDAFLWAFLDYVQRRDPSPWPADIPKNPNEAGWSFCFMGMPWFFNLNSPQHQQRASRNTTGSLSFVIQRTDSFAPLAPEEMHPTIIKSVRDRIAPYDGQAVSPALAGDADNPQGLEWIQYHLPTNNSDQPKKQCPFKPI